MTKVIEAVPRCKVCNRPLRSAEAQKNGVGKECAKKYNQQITSSREFSNFINANGLTDEEFRVLEQSGDERYNRILDLYKEELARQENPIPTFRQFLAERNISKEEIEKIEENVVWTHPGLPAVNPAIDPWGVQDIEDVYKSTPLYELVKEYRREIIFTQTKNYQPAYGFIKEYPVTVDYSYLSSENVMIDHAEFNGQNSELRVYARIDPVETNHPEFYEVVTFRKDTNGETLVTIESSGLYGGDVTKEIRNPTYNPEKPYEKHLYEIKKDYEGQMGESPVIPPEPEDLNSVFPHGYDCDYPLLVDKYKEYGVEIKGVRYYEPTDETPWTSRYGGGVMVIKLKDEKDGDVEIRYTIEDLGVVTTVKNRNKILNFREGTKDWLFHPTHLKYHQLLKETHRDYKEANRQKLEERLKGNLDRHHNNLRSLERAKMEGRIEGHKLSVMRENNENRISQISIALDSLNSKKDPIVSRLKEVVKVEENVKMELFKEKWRFEVERNKRLNGKHYEDNPMMGKIKGYFIKNKMKRMGIL